MGAGLRPGAKATELPPDPYAGAPVLDSTAVDRNGGYFITRLAANADPCIVGTDRQWRGRAIELDGKPLREVAGRRPWREAAAPRR